VQPIFQGGRLLAGIDLAQAGVHEAAAAYVATVLTAFGEVEGALEAETLLAERERHARAAAHQSRRARVLAQVRYEAGLLEFIDVLETERRAFVNAGEVIAARRERLENRIALHLALGGGFDISDVDAAPIEIASDDEEPRW
jgi:multidrug efflux system outer membrane protein